MRSEGKEFAFTKLMSCGLCGSGITADEKFKKQKNGNIHRHVYYGCTKRRDPNCKCGYINEKDLVEQFAELIDEVSLDEIGVKERIKAEVERFKKFQQAILGVKTKVQVDDIDIRNYAKYLLAEGSMVEKRELLSHLHGNLILQYKKVFITN